MKRIKLPHKALEDPQHRDAANRLSNRIPRCIVPVKGQSRSPLTTYHWAWLVLSRAYGSRRNRKWWPVDWQTSWQRWPVESLGWSKPVRPTWLVPRHFAPLKVISWNKLIKSQTKRTNWFKGREHWGWIFSSVTPRMMVSESIKLRVTLLKWTLNEGRNTALLMLLNTNLVQLNVTNWNLLKLTDKDSGLQSEYR